MAGADHMGVAVGELTQFGPCCGCSRTDKPVRNIMMLNKFGPLPGKGWGCVVCNLPPHGAIAVMCDDCVDQEPTFVCKGFAAEGQRVPVETLSTDVFDHDATVPH